MKVHLANYEPNRTGGGWTWSRYFVRHFGQTEYNQADIFLISGASTTTRDVVNKAKADGKKIVLRVDNHLLPSRNRNTGMQKMKDFAEIADLVIYQSEWAKSYLSPFLDKDGVVILNGVDTEVFKPLNKINEATYIRSSRIAEKGWEMARFWYSQAKGIDTLNIIGRFSRENLEYNFDFYNNESFRFLGEQSQDSIAHILGKSRYFLYSYFMDACSNTLLEARASGCELIDVYGALQTGGAPEIMALKDISIERCMKEYEQCLVALG